MEARGGRNTSALCEHFGPDRQRRCIAIATQLAASYSQFLDSIAQQLDISPSKYQIAVQRYTSAAKWLEAGDYAGSEAVPLVYPQGSFALGTVVRPFRGGEDADYDIDLVCQLCIAKAFGLPKEIKRMVGDRIRANLTYRHMLDDEGCRCWTLNYAETDGIGFHIDILPSVPEDAARISVLTASGVPLEIARQAIAITHRSGDGRYSWCASNPRGYVVWFNGVQGPARTRVAAMQKQALLEANRDVFSKLEDVPDQLVRTPLQRAIQILKRHRDVRFSGHELEDDKPISMIITTLAARLYGQEADTHAALSTIVAGLGAYAPLLDNPTASGESSRNPALIGRNPDGTWYIPNPINRNENFADRWHENNHRKASAFFQWIEWVREDLLDVVGKGDMTKIAGSLRQRFGDGPVGAAAEALGIATAATLAANHAFSVPHIRITDPPKPWGSLDRR